MGASATLWRHAPTAENNGEIFMGWNDPPLCESWWRENGTTINEVPFPLYASPLQRARATAVRLFPGATTCIDTRLRERGLGEWEGLSKEQVRRVWPQAFSPHSKQLDATFTPPGGETLDQFASRIRAFLLEASSQDHITAITHNGWIRTAMWVVGAVATADIYRDKSPHLQPVTIDLSSIRSE